ncbi:MAG: hypothetical protein LCH46_13020 [Proteobacteria bacterium]|nr:hypothetical protein [Pseudomonadota bacterium]
MRLRLFVASVFLSTAAVAAPISPERATELLARAQAINIKCLVLNESDRQELSDFVARAELSLAEKISVKAAKSALTKGRAIGRSATCGEASSQSVRDVLSAARKATSDGVMDSSGLAMNSEVSQDVKEAVDKALALNTPPKTSLPDEEQAVVVEEKAAAAVEPVAKPKTKPKPKVKVVEPAMPKPAKTPKVSGAYPALAESYYKELRCRTMPYAQVSAMYSRVVREHKAAVRAQGAAAVRQMLSTAKARAASRSC